MKFKPGDMLYYVTPPDMKLKRTCTMLVLSEEFGIITSEKGIDIIDMTGGNQLKQNWHKLDWKDLA